MSGVPYFIDSHCHIDVSDFDSDREEMLARAEAVGVREFVVVGASGSLEQARKTVEFASADPRMHPTVGVHPHEAAKVDPSWWPGLCELAARPEVVAVGETGLDFHYDSSPRQVQIDRFVEHIELAAKLDKAVICHIRDAHPKAMEVLTKHAKGRVRTIIHCFTGTPLEARKYSELGFYVSFSGIVTFKGKSTRPVRESVACVPLDRLLVESDSPYLAPVPQRGKRNEPSFLVDTAGVVATERGLTLEELAAITVANTRVVFGLTSP
ncbi:MAG: TatD family hydrolase [Myxococcales bacterium]|nr:TatD family hydrolase [Myxococcales bacterium]